MDHLAILGLLSKEELVCIASALLQQVNTLQQEKAALKEKEVEKLVPDEDNSIVLRKLFVRNIDFRTSHQDLGNAFSKYGKVEFAEVKTETNRYGIVLSKGYGFVIFEDTASANRALQDKNIMIYGRLAECYLAANGGVRPANSRSV